MPSGIAHSSISGRIKRRTWNLSALALAAGLITPPAHAFPAEIQVVAKVSIGKNPKLIVRVIEQAAEAVVNLKRKDGRTFNFSLGNVSQGTVRELRLDGRSGRHTYEGSMTAIVDGEKVSSPLSFETVVAAPITIKVDRQNLDLDKKRLEIFTNRKVEFVQLKIVGVGGEAIEETTHQITDWSANKPIVLRWRYADREELMRLELRVEDRDGFFNAIQLTPWQVEIPHEEVLFSTASAEITSEEVPKLEQSLGRVEEMLKRFSQVKGVQLFIAGHTDTQGGAAYNLNLSRRRAHAIAKWFADNNLPIPISFEGFGESALKVKTEDDVDEARNRRVDYILSIEKPALTRGSWKRIK